jgi:predicted nucleic acid-binding protein
MKRFVVDASVILKWILGTEHEPDHARAMELLNAWVNDQVEIMAPTLWEYEVGNFLGRDFPEEASRKMALLLNLRITNVHLNERTHTLCFSWMKQNGVTFYDAAYLAVAVGAEGILVTADERFASKMRNQASVCLLKDL